MIVPGVLGDLMVSIAGESDFRVDGNINVRDKSELI
jgi:hypothetical protein